MVASKPPADPPTPTIGQAKSFRFERAMRRADFALFRFVFAFARDAFFCAVRFGAMTGFFMVIPHADHTSGDCRWNATSGRVGRECGFSDFKQRLRRG